MYSPSDPFFTLFPKVSCFAAVLFLVGLPLYMLLLTPDIED